MILDTKQKTIEDFVNAQLKGNEEIFLVEVKVLPGNNIKVFIDADNGITIDKCIKINRALYNQIEASDIFPNGDFSLEVSSPGVDEPLISDRQYVKNIGRTVLVTPMEGVDVLGVLKEVKDDVLLLEVKEGKKKEIKQVEIQKAVIKKIVVQIIF
jgi:ribosome maturation factor RimP